MSSHLYHPPCHHHCQGYPEDLNQENHSETYLQWGYPTEHLAEKHLQSVIPAETPEKVLLPPQINQVIQLLDSQLMSEHLMPLAFHLRRLV